MDDRSKAVRKAKIGYFAVAIMLIVNLMLASSIFFELNIPRVREFFLAIGVLMALIYAVTFPTKLLPSGSYLIRCIVFVIMPLILILLIAMPNNGTVAIVSYVICVIISVFSGFMSFDYHKKVVKYISEESTNDYVMFEYKTFKVQEVNIYSLAFIFINFFILMSSGNDMILIVMLLVNLLVGLTLNYYRTRNAASDKIKLSHYLLESLSTMLAYVLVVVVNILELSSYIYIGAIVLLVPTVAVTIMTYKSLDNFMH